jgi:hypothetical protein
MGTVVGVALGVAAGAIGAYVGLKGSKGPRRRDEVAKIVIVIMGVVVLGLIASLYAPPAYRVVASIVLAVVAFVVNSRWAVAGGRPADEDH